MHIFIILTFLKFLSHEIKDIEDLNGALDSVKNRIIVTIKNQITY